MKLIYASLAALAAADVFEQIENVFKSIYSEEDNGFIIDLQPYYSLTFTDDYNEDNVNVLTWEETMSFYGDADKPLTCLSTYTEKDGGFFMESTLTGDYDQIPEELVEIFYFLGTLDYSSDGAYTSFDFGGTYDLSISESGFLFAEEGYTTSTNDFGGRAHATFSAVYQADIEIEEDYVNAILDLAWDTENDGYDEDFYMDNLNTRGEIEIEVGLDVEKCGEYFTALEEGEQAMRGIACDVEIDSDIALAWWRENYNIVVDNDINMSGVKISASTSFTMNDDEEQAYTVLLRGEDKKDKPELLSTKNFYGLYYHEGGADNTRSRMKDHEATLVWRMPGNTTIHNDLIPILEKNIIDPFTEFFGTLMTDYDSIPHLVAWFDKFLGTMKKNFDFSKFIKKARFDTDLSDHEDFNQWLQEEAKLLNEDLVNNVFKCPDMQDLFDESRQYVQDLTDENVGQEKYEEIWGGIF